MFKNFLFLFVNTIFMNSKTIPVLRSITDSEWSELRKYILYKTSQNSEIFRMFSTLRKHKNELDKWDSDTFHQRYFTKSTKKTMLNNLSTLYRWIEEYLVLQEMKEEKYTYDTYKVKMLNRRGVFHLADLAADKHERLLLNAKESVEKYEHLHKLYYNQYYSSNQIKYRERGKLKEKVSKAFVAYQTLRMSQYILEMQNWGRITSYDYENILDYYFKVVNISEVSSPLKSLFRDLEYFSKSKDLMAASDIINRMKSEVEEGTDTHVIVYYIILVFLKKKHDGKSIAEFSKLFYDLIEYGFDSGIFAERGMMTELIFMNFVEWVSVYKDGEEGRSFIDRRLKYVTAEEPETYRLICIALTYFHNAEYREAFKLVSNITTHNDGYKLGMKILQLLSSYQWRAEDYAAYKNEVRKLVRYLKREMSKSNKIYIIKGLNQAKLVQDLMRREYDNRILNIEDYAPLYHKLWAVEKINNK